MSTLTDEVILFNFAIEKRCMVLVSIQLTVVYAIVAIAAIAAALRIRRFVKQTKNSRGNPGCGCDGCGECPLKSDCKKTNRGK